MNSSNNVNIELRPGTRLIRETHGGREVMWVEDDTFLGMRSGSGTWIWPMLIVLFLFLMGSSAFGSHSDADQRERAVPAAKYK